MTLEEEYRAGLSEARKAGLAEGEERGRMSVAREMKKVGIDEDTIVQFTGLSIGQVRKM